MFFVCCETKFMVDNIDLSNYLQSQFANVKIASGFH